MPKRKRGFFQPNLGEHPPPLDEFFAELNRTDYSSGRIPWVLLPSSSSRTVQTSARSFGRGLQIVPGVVLALILLLARQSGRSIGGVALAVSLAFVVCLAGFGSILVRSVRRVVTVREPDEQDEQSGVSVG